MDQLTKFNQALLDWSGSENPRLVDGIMLSKFDTVDDQVCCFFFLYFFLDCFNCSKGRNGCISGVFFWSSDCVFGNWTALHGPQEVEHWCRCQSFASLEMNLYPSKNISFQATRRFVCWPSLLLTILAAIGGKSAPRANHSCFRIFEADFAR